MLGAFLQGLTAARSAAVFRWWEIAPKKKVTCHDSQLHLSHSKAHVFSQWDLILKDGYN